MSTLRPAVSPIPNSVAYSATSVTLFNALENVSFRSVTNATDKKLYIHFSGSAATVTTAHTRVLAAGETYDFPIPVYNNIVTAIGEAAGTGSWNTNQYIG